MTTIVKRFSIFVFTLFLLSACGGDIDDRQSVESAKVFLDNNNLRAAYLELKNALQANPENEEARYLLGQVDLTIGDSDFAAKEFRKAKKAGWDEGESEVGLMRAWKMGGQYKKILDEVKIKDSYAKPIQADLYALRAYAEAAQGYVGLAKVSMKKAREIDADARQVVLSGVQFELASGKSDVAREQVNKAISSDSDNTELLLLSAVIALQNKDNDKAEKEYRKILSLEPKDIITSPGKSARAGLARLEILNKNLQQAKDLLKPILKQWPNDPEVNFLNGMMAFETQEFNLAEDSLLKVLKVAPNHARTLMLFGAVNFGQKDYEQAAYYLGKYLQLAPDDTKARKLLGRTYMLMGQHNEAQAVLKPGLQDGDDSELLALIGLSQIQAGDIASGISGLQKALQVTPESKELRGELVKAYITAGETENAIKQLNTILAEGGDKNQAELLKVTAYLRSKQYDQAINISLDILERSPEDASVIAMVGNVFAVSGDEVEARKYFNKALKIAPDNVQAAMLLAKLEELEGNTDKAVVLYKKFSTNSESIEPMLALARVAEQRKDSTAMIDWLEKAKKQAPQDIRPRAALIEYYLVNSRFDKTAELVKEGLIISSNEPALLLLKAKMLMAQQRFNEALTTLNELVTRSPKSIYVRTLLGEAYMWLGQSEYAHRQLNLVLKAQPYYVPALLVLARTEQHDGNYAQAMKHAQQVKKIQPNKYNAYELIGDISMLTKDYQQAADAYKQVLAIKPSAEMVIKQSEALKQQTKAAQAIKVLHVWVNEHPADTRVSEFLGSAYLVSGENAKAIEVFEKVYKQQPENIVVLNNLAWLYSLINDSRAITFAEKAYKAKADDSGIQDTYGWILVQQGEIEKGRRLLELALKGLPDAADVRYHYAVAVYKSGEKIEGKKLLKRLLQTNQSFEGRADAQKLVSQ